MARRTYGILLAVSALLVAGSVSGKSSVAKSDIFASFEEYVTETPLGGETCCERVAAIGFKGELPIVIIDAGNTTIDYHVKTPARLCSCANGANFTDYNGFAELAVRGSSSAKFEKKSYKVTLRNETGWGSIDFSWLGFPKDSDWVLYGGDQVDLTTGMRDWVTYNAARESGHWATRTRWLEVFLIEDGQPLSLDHYWGVYIGEETVKRSKQRVDVSKWQGGSAAPAIEALGEAPASAILAAGIEGKSDVSGGYIFGSNNDNFDSSDQATATLSGMEFPLIVYYPEAGKGGNAVLGTVSTSSGPATRTVATEWLGNYVAQAKDVLLGQGWLSGTADNPKNYTSYFDVKTFVDYQLLVELTKSPDGYRDSTYLHKDKDGPIKAGPAWDFNEAYGECCGYPIEGYLQSGKSGPGVAGGSAISTEGWRFLICEDEERCKADPTDGVSLWFRRMWNDTSYRHRASERWAQLRAGQWSDAYFAGLVDDAAKLVRPAALRDLGVHADVLRKSWYATAATQWDTEVSNLRAWILARLGWMDAALALAGSSRYVYPGTAGVVASASPSPLPSASSPTPGA